MAVEPECGDRGTLGGKSSGRRRDPHQLQQVFLNLLNNAFDAIETIPRPGRIEVETVFRSEGWKFIFVTNGTGISNPDRIFEPFFTTKPVGKGTGLGLSIC